MPCWLSFGPSIFAALLPLLGVEGLRRGARVVEWVCLENRSARKGTGGSNPSLSAEHEPVPRSGRAFSCPDFFIGPLSYFNAALQSREERRGMQLEQTH